MTEPSVKNGPLSRISTKLKVASIANLSQNGFLAFAPKYFYIKILNNYIKSSNHKIEIAFAYKNYLGWLTHTSKYVLF